MAREAELAENLQEAFAHHVSMASYYLNQSVPPAYDIDTARKHIARCRRVASLLLEYTAQTPPADVWARCQEAEALLQRADWPHPNAT